MKKIIMSFLMFFCCTLAIAAAPFDQMVYFGDSLTDNGNLYRMLKIIPTSPPYYEGRFSNGPTWAEHVGDHYSELGIDTLNYSVGGATAIMQPIRDDLYFPPVVLKEEILDYYKNSPTVDKSKVFYSLWIGANDYLYQTPLADTDAVTTAVVDQILWALTSLIENGTQNLLVMNLPDLGRIPYARANNKVDSLSAVTKMHNQKLDVAMETLRTEYPNVKITFIDIFSLFNDVLDNIDKYNQLYGTHITDTMNACWPGKYIVRDAMATKEQLLQTELGASYTTLDNKLTEKLDAKQLSQMILSSPSLATAYSVGKSVGSDEPCENPDDHIFWDQVHPTRVVHEILAEIVVDTLEKQLKH